MKGRSHAGLARDSVRRPPWSSAPAASAERAPLSLAAQGARVALVDVSQENLDVVVRRAKDAGGEVKPLIADLRTAEACRRPSSEAVAAGRDAAGLPARHRPQHTGKPVLDLGTLTGRQTLTPEPVDRVLARPGRRPADGRGGYGRMVFVSSVSGLLAHPHHAPYAATKGGINQMLRVMAREWAPLRRHGQRGRSRLHRDRPDQGLPRQATTTGRASSRWSRPSGSAAPRRSPTRSRSSPPTAPRFITGQILYVDGGRTLV